VGLIFLSHPVYELKKFHIVQSFPYSSRCCKEQEQIYTSMNLSSELDSKSDNGVGDIYVQAVAARWAAIA